ncbi:MAG TPA: glycosyltransferase, partial [Methylophilaceae bacterium]|nr:glycosyltransferase [Methylophilaceae bacterium]
AHIDVIGHGPMEDELKGITGARLLGFMKADEIYSRMSQASYLVMPSIWYENFPRTLVEAYACGLPVIASRLGAMAELVHDGKTGLLFTPGDAAELAEKIRWADSHPEEMRRMGEAARREYEANYTSEINFRQLMLIYDEARHYDRAA